MGEIVPSFFDDKTGTMQFWEGRPPVRDLISTGLKQCTSTGVALCTVSAGKKAYVTGLLIQNTNAGTQTITIADTAGTQFKCTLATTASKEIVFEQPFLVLAEGAVTGTAGTGNHMEVTMIYFEKKTTQIA